MRSRKEGRVSGHHIVMKLKHLQVNITDYTVDRMYKFHSIPPLEDRLLFYDDVKHNAAVLQIWVATCKSVWSVKYFILSPSVQL